MCFNYFQLLHKIDIDVSEERITEVDHFNIVENLSDDKYILTKHVINFIINCLN